MSSPDRWIDRHLRRLRFGQFLARAGEWLAVFLLTWGVLILLVKLLAPTMWPHVLWVGTGALLVTAAAWWQSMGDRFSRPESVALLDRAIGAGGLLMTLSEAPDAEWASRLPHVERLWRLALPRIRPVRFGSCVALPLLFAVGVCFVPSRATQADPAPPTTVGRLATDQLEEMLTVLEQADVVPAEDEEQLREEIAKLAEEAQDSPLTHERWEAVDELERRMRMKLDEAALVAAQVSAAAELLEKIAAGEVAELSAEQMERLEEEVLETLRKLQDAPPEALSSTLSKELREKLLKLSKNRALALPRDPQERQELLDELQQFLHKEQDKLAEARQQANGGKCAHCGQDCEGGLCQACNGDGPPGQGGVNRGRGDAELTWGDEADAQGTKFRETVLPPGSLEDPKEEVVGVTLTAPDENPAAAAPRSEARGDELSTGRETWNRKLRPRHRKVVQKYFD